ncbi:MAG: hypothetical protein NVSMB32_12270 [Actinomycetota bacterium]
MAQRLADMLRPLPSTAIHMRGTSWTVGDAAAHLATTGQLFAQWAGGVEQAYAGPSTQELAAANAHTLEEFTERSGAGLADLILDATRTFLERMGARPSYQKVRTPLAEMDGDTLLSYQLTHLLGHGCSIAKALGKPMPVSRAMVPFTLPFLISVMPAVLKKDKVQGLNAAFLVHFRRGPQLAVTFDNGALSVSQTPPRRVDCHISADPVAFFQVALGNISQWGPIATGKLMTWGRKPWLALQFVGYFDAP